MLGQENGGSWDPELTGRGPQRVQTPALGIPQPCLPVAEWERVRCPRWEQPSPAFTRLTLSSRCAQVWTPSPHGQHSWAAIPNDVSTANLTHLSPPAPPPH